MLSVDIVDWLARSSVPLKIWKDGPEDAQLGTWLAPLDVARISAYQQIWSSRCRNCRCEQDKTVLFHGLNHTMIKICFQLDVSHEDICLCSQKITPQDNYQKPDTNTQRRTRMNTTQRRASSLSSKMILLIVLAFFIVMICFMCMLLLILRFMGF